MKIDRFFLDIHPKYHDIDISAAGNSHIAVVTVTLPKAKVIWHQAVSLQTCYFGKGVGPYGVGDGAVG